jgi:hypothetical protein
MQHAPSRLSQLARLHGVDALLGLNDEELATAVV